LFGLTTGNKERIKNLLQILTVENYSCCVSIVSTYNSLILITTDLQAWVDGSLSARAEKMHDKI